MFWTIVYDDRVQKEDDAPKDDQREERKFSTLETGVGAGELGLQFFGLLLELLGLLLELLGLFLQLLLCSKATTAVVAVAGNANRRRQFLFSLHRGGGGE